MPLPDPVSPEPSNCHVCHRAAIEGASFQPVKERGQRLAICPECLYLRDRKQRVSNLLSFSSLAGLACFMVVVSSAPRAPSFMWVLFNFAVGIMIMYVTAIPAKFVRALASRWLGLHNGVLHVGHGPLLFHGKLAGWGILWRAVPLGALLEEGPPLRMPTLPRVLTVHAVEPLVHFIMAAGVWLAMGTPAPGSLVPTRRPDPGWLFITVNLFEVLFGVVILLTILCLSLRRRPLQTGGAPPRKYGSVFKQFEAPVWNELRHEMQRTADGGIHPFLTFFRTTDPGVRAALIDSFRAAHSDSFLVEYMLHSQYQQAGDWKALQTPPALPRNVTLPPDVQVQFFCSRANAAARTGELDPALLRHDLTLFRAPPFSPLALCCALASAAHYLVILHRPEFLAEAGEWADAADCLAPGDTAVSCTSGCLHVETGDTTAGEIILRDVVARTPESELRGIACLFLALAAKRRGDPKQATSMARLARTLLSEKSLLLPRLEQEFGSPR